jgi:nucleotide-binding universal stress UspA family protein
MLPDIKRILYATDLSENAKYAYGYAADLAKKYDGKLIILFVFETISHVADGFVSDILGQEK